MECKEKRTDEFGRTKNQECGGPMIERGYLVADKKFVYQCLHCKTIKID